MKTKPLGKHQRAMLAFAQTYPGPHSLTSNRSDAAHAALGSLCKRGLMVRLQIGDSVFFELPQTATTSAFGIL